MPAGARELLLLLAALGLCPLAALAIGDDPAAPLARARAVAELEGAVGLHVEPALHAWALDLGWLVPAAGVVYVLAHVPVAGWALVWTWHLRRDAYPALRALFLWTQGLPRATWRSRSSPAGRSPCSATGRGCAPSAGSTRRSWSR